MECTGICAHRKKDGKPVQSKYLSHSHDSYEIFLILSGSCDFQVAAYRYRLTPDTVLLLRPGEKHQLLVNGEHAFEYLYAQFTEEILPADACLGNAVNILFDSHKDGSMNLWKLNVQSSEFIKLCMERMSFIVSENIFEMFLTYLRPLLQEIRLFASTMSGERCDVHKKDRKGDILVERVAEYITQNFAQIKDVSFVSELFHYSTVYINTLFKQRFGVSVWQFVLHKRIDRACDLMQSGMRAEQAALSCGFEDYSTFYRVFCKNYGMTPSACRKESTKPRLLINK